MKACPDGGPFLSLFGASTATWDYAKTYLSIVACGGPFVLIANCYANIVRTESASGQAMMGQLLGNLVNVILDPIMILGFGWNIAGAAMKLVTITGMVYMGLGQGILLTGVCYLFTEQLVHAFLTDQTAFSYAVQFAKILLTTSFLFAVFLCLDQCITGDGSRYCISDYQFKQTGDYFHPCPLPLKSNIRFNRISLGTTCCRCTVDHSGKPFFISTLTKK